jgi:hypothetical protein
LAQYGRERIGELDEDNLVPLIRLKYRAVSDTAAGLGGIVAIRNAFIGFHRNLYR